MMDANNQDGDCTSERFLSQKGQKGPLRMHQDSSQVQDLLFNTVRGVRDKALRQGKKPVDHTKANRKAIADQSKQNARNRAGLVDEVPQARPRKPPHAKSSDGSTSGRQDFVHQNIVDAGTRRKSSGTATGSDDSSKFLQKSNYGQVPTYLHERKMELAASYARQQAEREAALIPDGMRIMGDDERIETLAVLEKNKEEVEDALSKLPFVVKTPNQVRLKNQLERRLHEIEEAKKIFSRPKVLVKA